MKGRENKEQRRNKYKTRKERVWKGNDWING
jgi:hypothetical protein